MAQKSGDTKPFKAVSYNAATLARQKQKREYEKQKKEKIIFALFVVIILVMILFAILVFKNVLSDNDPADTGTSTDTEQGMNSGTDPAAESGSETDSTPVASAYGNEVLAKSDLYKGTLLLIDSSHPYSATPALKNAAESRKKFDNPSAKNGIAYSFYVGSTSDVELEEETLAALNAMANEFYEQTGNYDLYIPANAAYVKGAANDHATGRAFDLMAWPGGSTYLELDDASNGSKFSFILDNHIKYGFVGGSCGNAGLHLVYVGIPHASYMEKNSLSLDAYLTLLRTKHTFAENGQNNLVFTAEDGNRYEVYYVAASGDMISVPVPTGGDYTVSGDNQNGFVVTVKLK